MTTDIHFYSVRPYERELFEKRNPGLKLQFDEEPLSEKNYPAPNSSKTVCLFVEDHVDAKGMKKLKDAGVKAILLRSKGTDYVDLEAAKQVGMPVMNTEYGPQAIIEHAVALIMALARRLKPTMLNTMKGDFRLDGLAGPLLKGKTLGVLGTGLIGKGVADTMAALGMTIIAYDPYPNKALVAAGVPYLSKEEVLAKADVITLHCPLLPETEHLLDTKAFAALRDGAIVVNTSRGKLIDLRAALSAVESGKVAGLGLDVFEGEDEIVYKAHSGGLPQEITKLLQHPGVILTSHQAFFSEESLEAIVSGVYQHFKEI